MAGISKVSSQLIVRGQLFSTAQLRAFKITPEAALTADTQDATTKVITVGTARRLAEEIGTTAMLFEVAANGSYAVVVGDGHALDADTLIRRVRNVLGDATPTDTVVELDTLIGL
jgi:hypothetical protein